MSDAQRVAFASWRPVSRRPSHPLGRVNPAPRGAHLSRRSGSGTLLRWLGPESAGGSIVPAPTSPSRRSPPPPASPPPAGSCFPLRCRRPRDVPRHIGVPVILQVGWGRWHGWSAVWLGEARGVGWNRVGWERLMNWNAKREGWPTRGTVVLARVHNVQERRSSRPVVAGTSFAPSAQGLGTSFLWNPIGACQATGTPVVQSIALMVLCA